MISSNKSSLVTILGFAAAASLATGACRSSDPATVDAPIANQPDANLTLPDAPIVAADAAVIPGNTTIYDIQNPNNMIPTGALVTVAGVVVTEIDTFGSRTGAVWVEEVGGGPYSGVQVFGAPIAQVSALSIGDVVVGIRAAPRPDGWPPDAWHAARRCARRAPARG